MDTTRLTTAPILDLTPTDLDGIVDELHTYHAIFSPLFARREQRAWAQTYLHGLLLDIPRKSIEPIVLHLRGADRNAVRTLQQFVSIGAWEDGPILAQLWREIATDLGDDDGVLVVRRTIQELGGTMPEQLPTPEKSIKELETEERKRLRQRAADQSPQLPLFGDEDAPDASRSKD